MVNTMKRRTPLSYIVAGALFLLAGCSSSSTGPDNNDSLPIMPLKVGNMWIGRTQTFDSAGIVKSTTFDTLRIVSEEQIDGETWFRDYNSFLMTNRVDGLWLRENSFPDGFVWYRAKHPAAVGDIFNVDTIPIINTGAPRGPDTVTVVSYHVVATALEIAVPAGSYRSTKYQLMYNRLDGTRIEYFTGNDYAFAPGVGFVQQEDYAMTKSGKTFVSSRWELMEVTLK
jgi:hypothetical protein